MIVKSRGWRGPRPNVATSAGVAYWQHVICGGRMDDETRDRVTRLRVLRLRMAQFREEAAAYRADLRRDPLSNPAAWRDRRLRLGEECRRLADELRVALSR